MDTLSSVTPRSGLQAGLASRGVRMLHLWHLLSLDAPSVATLWMWFVARSVSLRLPFAALPSMFVAVWMLYAADRLLDARRLFSDPLHTDDLEARHLFHHRHATVFLGVILGGSAALAMLLPHLSAETLRLDAILATLLFGWFLLIHVRALPFSSAHRRLPKEIAVGIFFPAAVFIPTVAWRPDLRLTLLPQALLLAAVCTFNCLSIYAWEHPGPRDAAHWSTRLCTQRLRGLGVAIAVCGVGLTIFCLWRGLDVWPLAAAGAMSAVALLVLDLKRRHIGAITLRAGADLALLTPILLVPFLR